MANKQIKRFKKFPEYPGMDKELDSIIKQLNTKIDEINYLIENIPITPGGTVDGGLVGTKEVDEAAIGNDKIIVYKTASDKLEYEAKAAGSGDMTKAVYDPASKNAQLAADSEVVHDTGNETVAGIKTFSSFPVTPSSAPSANYEVANKKYVDDNIGTPYTDEKAQDAVGSILDDGGDIDFTYDDATPKITAVVKAATITEAKQVLADNTTNDVSTTKHGYVPKAPNDTSKFLRGDATWAALALLACMISAEVYDDPAAQIANNISISVSVA